VCASDQFTYLTRWVPAPERREAPRPPRPPSEDVETYRRLIDPAKAPRKARFLTRALVGLGAAGVVGLFMGSRVARDQTAADTDDDS
jgi:hypothetical protein